MYKEKKESLITFWLNRCIEGIQFRLILDARQSELELGRTAIWRSFLILFNVHYIHYLSSHVWLT